MQHVVWWIAQHTFVTALLIAAVALASCTLKTRPALIHALWLIVLLKFLMPPVVTWPWSFEQIASKALEISVADTGSMHGHQAVQHPSDVPSRSRWWAQFQKLQLETHPSPDPHDDDTKKHALNSRASTLGSWGWRWDYLAMAAWLVGTMIVLLVQGRRLIACQRLVEQARPAPHRLAVEIKKVAEQLNVRPVQTKIARRVRTPFVWCLGRLWLIWPESLSGESDIRRCRGVIAHELAHVKRRDYCIAWLELAAGCVWWWNPLFWFVRRRLRESADLACDAQALSVLPVGERRRYAELFLELSATSGPAPAPALGVIGSRRSFHRRLTMILNEEVSSRMSGWCAVAVAVVAVVALPAWSRGQIDDAAGDVQAVPFSEFESALTDEPQVEIVEFKAFAAALDEEKERKSGGSPSSSESVQHPSAQAVPTDYSADDADVEQVLVERALAVTVEQLHEAHGAHSAEILLRSCTNCHGSLSQDLALTLLQRAVAENGNNAPDAPRSSEGDRPSTEVEKALNAISQKPAGWEVNAFLRALQAAELDVAFEDPSNRGKDSPALAEGAAHRASDQQLNVVNLAESYWNTQTALDTARAMVKAIQKEQEHGYSSEVELALARGKVRSAERKLELLRTMIEVMYEAAKEDYDNAEAASKEGSLPESRLVKPRANLRMLKQVLDTADEASDED